MYKMVRNETGDNLTAGQLLLLLNSVTGNLLHLADPRPPQVMDIPASAFSLE